MAIFKPKFVCNYISFHSPQVVNCKKVKYRWVSSFLTHTTLTLFSVSMPHEGKSSMAGRFFVLPAIRVTALMSTLNRSSYLVILRCIYDTFITIRQELNTALTSIMWVSLLEHSSIPPLRPHFLMLTTVYQCSPFSVVLLRLIPAARFYQGKTLLFLSFSWQRANHHVLYSAGFLHPFNENGARHK